MVILSIDASLNSSGLVVFATESKEYLYADYFHTNAKDELHIRILAFLEHLKYLVTTYKVNQVVLEDYLLQAFKSQIKTLIGLGSLNTSIRIYCAQHNIPFAVLNVNTVRAQLKKLSKSSERIKKEDVAAALSKIVPIPEIVLKYKEKPYYNDVIDSLALLVTFLFASNNKETNVKKCPRAKTRAKK